MALDLFETLNKLTGERITDFTDLNSEFVSTDACCEEGACCWDPA